MRNKITVIGSLNYDIILKVPALPRMGETLPAADVAFSAGGKGANQAVQAAKLGVPTYMVGCTGKDNYGDVLINAAAGYGVNTGYIKRVDAPTGMGIVNALEDGSVFATIVRGANFKINKSDIDALEPLLEETELVILQMEIPMEINCYAIDKAKAAGCKILLNAAPAEAIDEEYLRKVDILVVNEVEASFYTGTTIDSVDKAVTEAGKLHERIHADCIFTLGKVGSVIATDEVLEFIPARKVNAVETTGAGDSFIGGLGYALLKGMKMPEACRFATRCSAITVCRYGAQPSMPVLEEVKMEE